MSQFSHEIQSSTNLKVSADVDWKSLYKNRTEVHKRWKKGEAKVNGTRFRNNVLPAVARLKFKL